MELHHLNIFSVIILLLVLFIFQIILIVSESKYKKLNEKIKNWKKSPILGFSLSYEGENYDKVEYFEVNKTKIYIKRMPKEFNLPYLLKRENTLLEKKQCGTDESHNPIYFERYEECPINKISIDDKCLEENKCLLISDKYLNYLNNKINEPLVIDLNPFGRIKKGYLTDNPEEFPNDFEYVLSIKKNKKLCNILSISLICVIIIIVAYLFYYLLNYGIEKSSETISLFLLNLIIVFIIIIIICSISKIYMNVKLNKILIELSLKNIRMKKSIYNLECTNLFFLILFGILIVLIYYQKFHDFQIIIPYIYIIVGLILSGLILIPVILSGIGLMYNPFNNNSFYNDLKKNYEMSPITEIEISRSSTIKNSKDSSYFNPKVPYRLGIIEKSDKKKLYLTEWKKNSFYVSRMDKKYTYPKITRIKNNNNNKICGKDSNGNNLYFPKNEACPINYIEFTNSEKPTKEYNFITKKIDQSTYMHYTNEYIEGEILVHLRISNNNLPIGNDDYYNELCHYLYEDDNCKSDKEYLINDGSKLYGYEEIDNDNSTSINNDDVITNKKIYLYKRSYVGIKSDMKIGNEFFYIKSFIDINQSITMICYILIGLAILYNYAYESNVIINHFAIVLNLISIILNFITIQKYGKVKKIIDYIDLDLQFPNKPLFIKLDIGVIVILFLLLTFIIFFFYYKSCKNASENTGDECKFSFKYDLMDLKSYNKHSLYFLFFLFIIILLFLSLLIGERLYNESYIETIRQNWNKAPIMNITLGYRNEKIGSFKNFKNRKSQDIYNWQGISFNFIRKSNKYTYPNIIKDSNFPTKKCGIDNQGNILYFNKYDDCPINYVKITSSIVPPEEIKDLKHNVLKLNNDSYLHFSNDYTNGKILIDFKISNFNGPCLNKNMNNEICSFFLKKCDLEEKDYICNAYKSINAYDKINNYPFEQFIQDNELNTHEEEYDKESKVYLYSETYIGFEKIDKKVKKYSPEIFTISKVSNTINIFLFILFILLVLGFTSLFFLQNELIIIIVSLFIVFLSLLLIILTLISFIKYFVISKNLFQKLGNEISDYFSKTRWQVSLTIFLFLFFIGFFIYIVMIILNLIEFKKIIVYCKKIFEIVCQRKNLIYFTFIFNIIIIILIFITLILKEYNDTSLNILKDNWKKSPIKSISIDKGESWELGEFKGSILNNWKSGILKLNRMDNKNYFELVSKNFKNENGIKKCGENNNGIYLYVKKYEECPINYIYITNDLNNYTPPNVSINYFPVNLGDYYIIYSNEYTEGKILIDFKISDFIIPSLNPKLNNQICKYIDKKCDLNSKKLNYEISGNEFLMYEQIDSISLPNFLENNNININSINTTFYLYTQTYIGCDYHFSNYSFFLNRKKFSTIKNLVLFFFTIFFLLIPIAFLDFVKIKLEIEGIIIIYIIPNILILINFILSFISVLYYNTLINNLLKDCENSIGEDFKSRKWYCKINICFIIFYLIDLVIGIYLYIPFKEKFITGEKNEISSIESLRKELGKLSKEEERLKNEISKGELENKENKKKIDEELNELDKLIDIINDEEINEINNNISNINNTIKELEEDLFEKENEFKNLDEIIIENNEIEINELKQELDDLKNQNEQLENENKSLALIKKEFNRDYYELLSMRNNTI